MAYGQTLPQEARIQARDLRRRSNRLARRMTALWRHNASDDFGESFALCMPEMFGLLDDAQLMTASEALELTPESMASLDGMSRVELPAQYSADPRQWVGVNGNGFDTIDVMWGAVTRGKQVIANGGTVDVALHVIELGFEARMRTCLADTQRSAAIVAGHARNPYVGYVRGLTPPSCGRCVVLAGRPCGSEPFERHPRCDCIAVPTAKKTSTAVTSANDYLDGLDDRQLVKVLGSRANARAWKDGADLNQLVNAYRRKGSVSTAQVYDRRIKYTVEGTTKRGFASGRMISAGYAKEFVKNGGRYTKVDRPRLMPETIYQICEKTGKDPRRMLYDYGWLL